MKKKYKILNNLVRIKYHKSRKHIYLQADLIGIPIVTYSTKNILCYKNATIKIANILGKKIGISLVKRKIFKIFFEKGIFKYHGKVKACADGIRSSGIKF